MPHRTAISRKKPSLPARLLSEMGLLKGRVLDYGCGRGKDAEYFGLEKWDPHFSPERPKGRFDTVMCNYVLCVTPFEEEANILQDIQRYLTPEGTAYISIRNDISQSSITKIGTIRRCVNLCYLPSLCYKPSFAIHWMQRGYKVYCGTS
jgi:2-polyprenyl-3-methyl-5-hydroxy-6-metoxy-1,4-benzoquinol methylase